ncbi:DMT family transporter [Planotetraspora sp. A-T 1434]|uniref:DMT family transporter n=1 Tax=Planotetraspora sp. A-T 1434 TaxID=2979219 RepID=UPI0021BE728A|nr:DMT family transporter [Planotetraspora sp. A-T 1434]MCT9930975.1 DMT family transporter [Planotetraspora sp. A-T 1434]
MIWVGISIALVGALGYALGAALQQFEAVSEGATLKLVKRPRWWIGGVIGFAGASLHAVALSFAPLVVVQPVSVATLVFAVPLSALLHGRRPHRAEILGSVAVAAGLLGLMLLIPARNVTPVLSDRSALGLIGCVALIVAVTFTIARWLRGPLKALSMAIGAGSVTATVSTFVRVVGGGLGGDLTRLLHWFTLAVPVLLVCAVVLLQKSYAVGYFGIAYAGVQVVDPITSVTAGALLLGESLPTGAENVIPALLAAAVLIAGTITLGRLTPDHLRAAPVAEEVSGTAVEAART